MGWVRAGSHGEFVLLMIFIMLFDRLFHSLIANYARGFGIWYHAIFVSNLNVAALFTCTVGLDTPFTAQVVDIRRKPKCIIAPAKATAVDGVMLCLTALANPIMHYLAALIYACLHGKVSVYSVLM
jgi:hypothetical protein